MLKIPKYLLHGDHAVFSPSGAHRWMNCTASISRSIDYGQEMTILAAQEGIAAHWVLKRCLNRGWLTAEAFRGGTAPNGYEISDEMCVNVEWALKWIHSNCDGFPIVESKIPISNELDLPTKDPIIFGTSDLRVMGEGVFWILDFKYETWDVSAKRNPQLELYAIGSLPCMSQHDRVNLGILQPRAGGAKIAHYTVPEIEALKAKYEDVIKRILEGEQRVSPSRNNCYFCPAQNGCSEAASGHKAILRTLWEGSQG